MSDRTVIRPGPSLPPRVITRDAGGADSASIKTKYESNANTNAFTDTLQSKLGGIEAGADVTDAANVGASVAGATELVALDDSEKFAVVHGGALKWIAGLRGKLKTYFDTLYSVAGHNHTGVYDPAGSAAAAQSHATQRGNHSGEQAQATITGLPAALNAKAPLASPALTGTPTAPTPATVDDSTKLATTAHVQAVVRALVGLAPAELDTLVEIAASLAANASSDAALVTVVSGKMAKGSNLSDLTNLATALVNLGLDQVNNTPDASKPVSTAQQAALDALWTAVGDLATQVEAEAASVATVRRWSPLRIGQAIVGRVTTAFVQALGFRTTADTDTIYGNDYRAANFAAGTDYLAPNGSAAALTGFPTFNQNTTGNAATVTTNANLTGPVTSTGNTTTIAAGAITSVMLANGAVAFLLGTNTGDNAPNTTSNAYADSLVVGLLDDRGNHDASANTFPSSGGSGAAGAVLKGDLWTVSVAGTLGGAAVTAGDVLRSKSDTPGQTAANWAITENNLGYVPQNTAGTLSLGSFSGITGTLADANIASAAAWNAKQGAITLGAGVLSALAINIGATGAPVLFGSAGGTPTSITLTNATGTAAGLTAGNVTTNADLTGVITSVGNATAIADAALDIAKTSGLQTALDLKANSLGADDNYVTDAEKTIIGATTASFLTAQQTKLGHISVTQAVDLDAMETDIAALANGMVYKGDWNASAGTFPGAGAAQIGWFYNVSVGGTVNGIAFDIGDSVIAKVDNASTATYASNWVKKDQTDAVQSVAGKVGAVVIVAADLADFESTVTANSAVAANTAKTSNATHTGDVTGSGALTIASSAVTLAKMANLAQDQFIGRTTASTGVPQTATITAAARTMLDDTTVAAMVNTLGGATATGTGGIVRAVSPSFTGTVKVPLGAEALPPYTFTGDLNTGMWSPAADTLAWSTNGVERMRISSTGAQTISSTGVLPMSITGSGAYARLVLNNVTGSPNTGIVLQENSVDAWTLASFDTGAFTLYNHGAGAEAMGISDANAAHFTGSLHVGGTSDAIEKLDVTGNIKASGTVASGIYTVATLPVVATFPRARAFVSDSNATHTAGIGAVVAGGGANIVPVYSDGTNWRIG